MPGRRSSALPQFRKPFRLQDWGLALFPENRQQILHQLWAQHGDPFPTNSRKSAAGIHLLPVVGKAIWNNTLFQKELTFVEVMPHDLAEAFNGKGRFDDLTGVGAEFYAETKHIQTVEPEELRRIRLGEISETGNYGQYFTAWDFTKGLLLDYITFTAFNCIKYVDILLPHKAFLEVIDAEDEHYSEYLGFSGLVTLREFSLKLRSAIRETNDKEEVRILLQTFVMYGNRLCAWSYHCFPWHIGVLYA